jgi:diaminohydroxyphosphoribosylaminopyrimidine deaminase/5-amino-6-(5-phosphoribosylamino)uracil reductase
MAPTTITDSFDQLFMQRALQLAKRGMGWTNPNPMVGSVVVKDQQIIGEGWHKAVGQPHAEIEALKACEQSPQGATLYVTLTPCNHHGRTPPCTQAITQAGIKRVVIAAADPTAHAQTSIQVLQQHGIQITTDVFAEEAQALNLAFYHQAENNSMYVHAKWAMSLDGRMAVQAGDDPALSSPQSLARSHQWRQYCDAILVGVHTVIHDNPQLTTRYIDSPLKPKHPARIILDPSGKTPLHSRVLDNAAKTLLITSDQVSEQWMRHINYCGHQIKQYPLDALGLLPLHQIIQELYDVGIGSMLVEGGESTRDYFLDQSLVHGMSVCLSPYIIGQKNKRKKQKWSLQQYQLFAEDCYLTYK